MTVFLVTVIKRFIGESFDTKPSTGIPPGSTFYETDTKNTVIYSGSAWVHTVADPVLAVRAAQAIKISLEEDEWETAYIINAVQRIGYVEARTGIVYSMIPGAVNTMKFSEAAGLQMDGDLRITDRMAVVDSSTGAHLQGITVTDRFRTVDAASGTHLQGISISDGLKFTDSGNQAVH
jgi:hypothetical protein